MGIDLGWNRCSSGDLNSKEKLSLMDLTRTSDTSRKAIRRTT